MKIARKTLFGALVALSAWAFTTGVPAPPQTSSTPETILLGPGIAVRNVENPFDYFNNSWAVIGLKDFPDATRLSPVGEFLLGGGAACRLLVGESLLPLDNRVKKTLAKGYLPVVTYDFILNDAVRLTMEAFAAPLDDASNPSTRIHA